jgi:hypothetical protein
MFKAQYLVAFALGFIVANEYRQFKSGLAVDNLLGRVGL